MGAQQQAGQGAPWCCRAVHVQPRPQRAGALPQPSRRRRTIPTAQKPSASLASLVSPCNLKQQKRKWQVLGPSLASEICNTRFSTYLGKDRSPPHAAPGVSEKSGEEAEITCAMFETETKRDETILVVHSCMHTDVLTADRCIECGLRGVNAQHVFTALVAWDK